MSRTEKESTILPVLARQDGRKRVSAGTPEFNVFLTMRGDAKAVKIFKHSVRQFIDLPVEYHHVGYPMVLNEHGDLFSVRLLFMPILNREERETNFPSMFRIDAFILPINLNHCQPPSLTIDIKPIGDST